MDTFTRPKSIDFNQNCSFQFNMFQWVLHWSQRVTSEAQNNLCPLFYSQVGPHPGLVKVQKRIMINRSTRCGSPPWSSNDKERKVKPTLSPPKFGSHPGLVYPESLIIYDKGWPIFQQMTCNNYFFHRRCIGQNFYQNNMHDYLYRANTFLMKDISTCLARCHTS